MFEGSFGEIYFIIYYIVCILFMVSVVYVSTMPGE